MRGIIGALGALVVYRTITQVIELTVVASFGGIPPDDVSFFEIRNRPAILAAKMAYSSLGAVLAGYVAAKVAGEREMYYGSLAALLLTAQLVWLFLGDEYAHFTPVWMRAFLVLTTGPAMLIGAMVRARARVAQDAADAATPQRPA